MANVSLKFPKFGGCLHSSHFGLQFWAPRDSTVLEGEGGSSIYIKFLGVFFMIRLAAKMDGMNVCMEIGTEK